MAPKKDLSNKNNKKSSQKKDVEKVANNTVSRRVKKNEQYYEKIDLGLTFTKQQKFNFDNNNYEDEMDTSFVDKSKRKKKEPQVIVQKSKYAILTNFIFISIIFLLVGYILYHFITFDHKEVKIVTKIKTEKEEIVPENILFLGDSITYFYKLEDYFPDTNVVNSGIGGNVTDNILENMKDRVYQYNPSKVFLLIGTNDLNKGASIDKIVSNIEEIIRKIQANRPYCEIYLESIYPINKTDNDKVDMDMVNKRNNQDIKEINNRLEDFCNKNKITFINMYKELQDDEENLKLEYTNDGLHLSDLGYEIVTKKIKEYLNKR